jgi:uncharacterized protein
MIPDAIREMLGKYKTLAVVGLSSHPVHPSYRVCAYMQSAGYRIIPVNPFASEVLGQKAYPRLQDVPEPLEIVVIFRQPRFVPEVVEAAIARGASVIWMQEGVIHVEAAEQARKAGLEVVMDRCILKEHAKRFVSKRL